MNRIVKKTIKIMMIQMITVFGLFFVIIVWRLFYYAK